MLRRGETLPGYGPYTYPEEEAEVHARDARRRMGKMERADHERDARKDERAEKKE